MKNPYRYPLRSRKDIIEYLTDNGGYHSFHQGNYALSFNVKADRVDFDWDNVWDKYHSEYLPEDAGDDENVLYAFKVVAYLLWEKHQESLWDWGLEDAQSGVFNDEGACMLWCGKMSEVEWAFAGRSGGYLCPARFNGYDLEIGEEEFEELLGEMEWPDLYDFYRLACQWGVDFTPQAASSEVEYLGAFNLFVNIVEPEWDRPPEPIDNRPVLHLQG
jgi:hypothetical protein